MKIKYMVTSLVGLFAAAAYADATWQGQKGSGYIDDVSMWSSSPAPIYSTVTSSGGRNYAQVWPGTDWISTMYLKDIAIFNGGFSVNMQPGRNNSLIFDGADVALVHGDVPDGMSDRDGADAFFCENGSGGDYRYFACGVGDRRHAAYLWSNAWFRINHRHRTPGSTDRLDAVNALTFGRGYFLWGGTNLTDMAGTTTVNGGKSNGLRTEMTVTNATVVLNNLNWAAMIGESSLLVDGPDAELEVLGLAYFGRNASTTQPGTNVFTVSGGATMRVNTHSLATTDVKIGPYTASPQTSVMTITGPGSLYDYSLSSRGMGVYDGGGFVVSNGATAHLRPSLSVSGVAGNPGGFIRVVGEGSTLKFGSPESVGTPTISVSGGEDSRFELDGGLVRSYYSNRRLTCELGQLTGSFGTLRISGGTLDMGGSADGETNGYIRVGMAGSGFLDVSGGEIIGCASIEIAERDGETGPTTNRYRQTGGYVEAIKSGLMCKKAANPQRHVFVELLGGVLCTYRLSGGAGRNNPEADLTDFYADGGTIRSTVSGCYHETWPFFYGFNNVQLGPKGLTLDIKGRSNIVQRFTDGEGETGRLYVTGQSTYTTVWFESPDGGDNAELVVGSLPVAAIGNAMTNWQTTVVVTNGAAFDVSAVGRLSLKGLSLGDEVSAGEVRLAATNRLVLANIIPRNAVFRMIGDFSADTDYPLITVKGAMTADQILLWKGSTVNGAVSSDCVPRLGCVYSAEDDETTLVFRFEKAVAPSGSNVWSGTSDGDVASWTNSASWSAGVPTAASKVEFSSDDAAVSSALSVDGGVFALGALAFSSLRDYVISGNGLLFFEDGGTDAVITVAAGDQRIDVPVGAVRDISLSVAAGASLTFGEKLVSSAGQLLVNGSYETGHVVLEGEGSAFKDGITHRGGILEASAAEVFGDIYTGGTYMFKGYGLLRIGGDEAEEPCRLPFGFEFCGGSNYGTTWGSAVVIDTDREIVVPPYVTSMSSGGSFVKFGRAPMVFETSEGIALTLSLANGTSAWENGKLPQNSVFAFDETTGKAVGTRSYGGVNVYEGELVYRGTDNTEPTAASQSVKNGFGTVIGFRTTNSVDVTPGLVLDRVYADFGKEKPSVNAKADLSYVSLLQDAHDLNGPFPRAATNAYLVVSNGSTLVTGSLRVGATTFGSSGFLHVSPRIAVDGSTVRTVTGLDFAAQDKVHAEWRVVNGSTLLAGTNGVVWAGEAQVSVDGGSVFSGTEDGPAAIALGAGARGMLSVTAGSLACIGEVTAADGAAVEFRFDGGALSGCGDGGTIAFPDAVGLSAGKDGLHLDVPAGETWTLATDVAGPGYVTLGGPGTLALSGTVRAGFAGTGTVSGGTLENGRLRADISGAAGTPTFVGTKVSGRIEVDLGRGDLVLTKPYPTGVTVATFTGEIPPASAFRPVNAGVDEFGRRVSCVFAVTDGVVTFDTSVGGFSVLIR